MMVVLEGCENDSMAPKLEKGEYNFTYGDKDQLERETGRVQGRTQESNIGN